PWTSTATQASVASGTRTAARGTPPAAGAQLNFNATALFDGVNDVLTASGTLGTYVAAGAGTITVLFYPTSAAAAGIEGTNRALISNEVDNYLIIEQASSAGVPSVRG